MDRNNTIANTVSIRNGRFSDVDGAAPTVVAGTRVIDLRGPTVVPGIIDSHNHVVLMGNRPGYHVPLENACSIGDVQESVAARAEAIPRGAWITTIGGFHRNQLFPPGRNPRLPTLMELDSAAPGNPVYISESFIGPSTTNSLGKAFFERQALPVAVGEDGSIAAGPQATGRATLALRQTLLTPEQRNRGAIEAMALLPCAAPVPMMDSCRNRDAASGRGPSLMRGTGRASRFRRTAARPVTQHLQSVRFPQAAARLSSHVGRRLSATTSLRKKRRRLSRADVYRAYIMRA
jgi:hypothetical protein